VLARSSLTSSGAIAAHWRRRFITRCRLTRLAFQRRQREFGDNEPIPHATLAPLDVADLEKVRARVQPLLPVRCEPSRASLLEEFQLDRWRELEPLPPSPDRRSLVAWAGTPASRGYRPLCDQTPEVPISRDFPLARRSRTAARLLPKPRAVSPSVTTESAICRYFERRERRDSNPRPPA
jgi:hypothetical protein